LTGKDVACNFQIKVLIYDCYLLSHLKSVCKILQQIVAYAKRYIQLPEVGLLCAVALETTVSYILAGPYWAIRAAATAALGGRVQGFWQGAPYACYEQTRAGYKGCVNAGGCELLLHGVRDIQWW
jgi:hypothetical protein